MKIKVLRIIYLIGLVFFIISCNNYKPDVYNNIIDYAGTPKSASDRSISSFSDQGAWFSYSFPDSLTRFIGFSGPFLMTQENGAWLSPCFSGLEFFGINGKKLGLLDSLKVNRNSYLSHLEQVFSNNNVQIKQALVYQSSEIAIINNQLTNISNQELDFRLIINGLVFNPLIKMNYKDSAILLTSDISTAQGKIYTQNLVISEFFLKDSIYEIRSVDQHLDPGNSLNFSIIHKFSFNINNNSLVDKNYTDVVNLIEQRKKEKEIQIRTILERVPNELQMLGFENLTSKCILTLQNNWRSKAGGIKHEGCFPSYHYKWFNGFWAWDSWKHAAALALFNPELAKNQIRAMYDYQEKNGFIPDCIFRDTLIEPNNYRNSKPPLSGWAIWKVIEESKDLKFLKELYPKLKLYHCWWYTHRDHDQDGICEYGSTDGTLVAAKWESGMDNAIRFDRSTILKNNEDAYSLNQESIDLNSYLYAEKIYLFKMAEVLGLKEDYNEFRKQADELRTKIIEQFWDNETGWFYDTDIEGKEFIKVMGPEGWIPLWANIPDNKMATLIKDAMLDSTKFYTRMPFPTISTTHPEFNPEDGYWRGPVWLDQAYFAIVGLKKYGFSNEATQAIKKLINNAEGLTEKGVSLRENYNPLTGAGLESHHFSWTAAHYLLLIAE